MQFNYKNDICNNVYEKDKADGKTQKYKDLEIQRSNHRKRCPTFKK